MEALGQENFCLLNFCLMHSKTEELMETWHSF